MFFFLNDFDKIGETLLKNLNNLKMIHMEISKTDFELMNEEDSDNDDEMSQKISNYIKNYIENIKKNPETIGLKIFEHIKKNPEILPHDKFFCVDFDGTIVEFDDYRVSGNYFKLRDNVKTALELIKDNDNFIIIHTCRRNTDDVADFLNEKDIPFDFINENPYAPDGANSDKVFADYYIDDRAIQCVNWHYVLYQLIMEDTDE